MRKKYDHIWVNAMLVCPSTSNGFNTISDGAIGVKDGKIALITAMSDLVEVPSELADKVHHVNGHCLTPGLIDCHTHIVFGGNRSSEFEMRLEGKSYQEIAQAGGGIISSVLSTRDVSQESLVASAFKRIDALIQDGVTTIEIKSGYGLDFANERKMLRAAKKLQTLLPITIQTTFLGAHALPPEFKHNRSGYIDLICNEMLPALHDEGLIDAVDAFCETIAFTVDEVERVFEAATKLAIPVKVHAEQLSNCGASKLAAKYSALSADHLEYLDQAGVEAMASSGTVAVLLPGAYFMLRETQKPPVELLRQYNVPMAVATDSNPGTSPALSARLMMVMACQQFGLTPVEAFNGMTQNAAKALGLESTLGSLEVGKSADFAIWDVEHPAELVYWLGGNKAVSVIKQGDYIAGAQLCK